MALLTDYTSYADAHRHCTKDGLWALFDGDRQRFNITHECLDRHPRDKAAMRVVKAEGGYDTYTFGELSDGASRFANYLRRQEIAPGERVAVMLEPSFEFYETVFGAIKAGCIAVPLFTLFGQDGLHLRVDDCQPKVLVTTPDKLDITTQLTGLMVLSTGSEFQANLEAEDSQFAAETSASDIAVYQYTSGTTRELPEAVRHRHGSVVTLMLATLYGTGIRPNDRLMIPSSPAWGHGLWHGTIAPFSLGVTSASYAGKFDAARCMEAIQDLEITNLSAAATHYRMMRRSGLAQNFTFALEKLSFTGEPMDSETDQWIRETFGKSAGSFYGTTEVGVILVSYPGAEDFEIKPGSLGKPLPGIELEIHDAAGNECPPGKTGEIMMRRRGEWFPTKDLGRTDEDGYFYHGGRADDVIISAGWTMGAVEIEDVLLKHPDVDEAAVIGVPDEERGQIVKAFIVSKQRAGSAEFENEIQTFTQQRLSRHEYPRVVDFVDNLPKTPAGKVNRKRLRDDEKAARQSHG
jgi:acetyl-CoA synthetase